VDDIPILGRGDDHRALQHFVAQYGAPAYVRRARQVQEAFDNLLARCGRQREEWLALVRVRLGTLQALAGDWGVFRPWLVDETQIDLLQELAVTLSPRLRAPVERTSSPRLLRRALGELRDSLEHFNRRWLAFLPTVELAEVNELRQGYNRYYLLEKECAVRSARVARQGYRPLPLLTSADLAALLPPLPVPRIAG
jgi:hypothetical protein